MRTARQKKIIREIQRLHGRRLLLNLPAIKRSHPKLIEEVYAIRPFWGWKQALEDAGLSYAKINVELQDEIECKICGQVFAILPNHLRSRHEVTAEDYRDEYPDAPVVCETIRARIRECQLRKPLVLPHWEAIWSAEYVLDRLAELHRLNFPMSSSWAGKIENGLVEQTIEHFGSWSEALRRIGLDAEKIRLSRRISRQSKWWRADKGQIVAELRRRKRTGETLFMMSIQREKLGQSLLRRSRQLFGNWSAALIAAGLEPPRIQTPWPRANKTALLAEIRRRQVAGESLGYGKLYRSKGGAPLVRRAGVLFGSWNAALLAAGMELPKGSNTPWLKANKAAILAEIRRRERAGESLQTTIVTRARWGCAFMERTLALFGSWTAALLEAGVKLPVRARSPWWGADEAEILAELRRRKRAGEPLRMGKISEEKWGSGLVRRANHLFGSWNVALVSAGLEPPEPTKSPWPDANPADILAELRRRERTGESLHSTKILNEKWGYPLVERTAFLFGSWTAALLQAGIDPPIGTWSPWPDADKAEILAEIHRRQRASESLRYGTIERQQWGVPLLQRAKILFGSWNAALLAAGIAFSPKPGKANR